MIMSDGISTPPYQLFTTITDPHQHLLHRLAEAPRDIQSILVTVVKDCQPQDVENVLVVTVPYMTIQKALSAARKSSRQDLLLSVSILAIAMAVVALGVVWFR